MLPFGCWVLLVAAVVARIVHLDSDPKFEFWWGYVGDEGRWVETARNLGDALLIGVNSDDAVRQLKGPERPVNIESDRAAVLAALQSVDGVCIFNDRAATEFLKRAQPDIYVKGGDYTLETLNQDERRAVEGNGGRIVLIPFVPGKSTTGLLQKISRL